MHMIRKGQARCVSGSDGRCQIHFIEKVSGLTANYHPQTPHVRQIALRLETCNTTDL
jgi:hypothetical protein